MNTAASCIAETGLALAPVCASLGLSRATIYRRQKPQKPKSRPSPPRTLGFVERQIVLDTLNGPRFADLAPAAIYATLLDEGEYLCSVGTMYRILHETDAVHERRNQLSHPKYVKPQLVANAPNQVWTWDITKLLGPVKWTYFYLYVILDIFSRYTVGWMLAHRESSELAKRLISETCIKQGIVEDQLTIHSDRGTSMTSKPVALLLADLGVTKSHSRPRVSDDNPFSESQFKTLKYHRAFPERFGCIEDGRAFCGPWFDWYNNVHKHSGLAMITPSDVHHGRTEIVLSHRQAVLDAAYDAHPERFVGHPPRVPRPPSAVWINPPQDNLLQLPAIEPGPFAQEVRQ